jgi:hypothetical protein
MSRRATANISDPLRPIGHQLYFWTFVVAVLIFGVGAGVSVVEGIRRRNRLKGPCVNYLVLGVARSALVGDPPSEALARQDTELYRFRD